MMTETQELVKQAQEKKYADFDKSTKEVLAQKVAEKLAEKGYFDRLDQAKGITEGYGNAKGSDKKLTPDQQKAVKKLQDEAKKKFGNPSMGDKKFDEMQDYIEAEKAKIVK